ncbi:MAG TPA: type II secretion system secretin GspD [Nevskiaceae bacterium]|nr:type II secretion system secretin GspD [Nevskiaceae bacterium]
MALRPKELLAPLACALLLASGAARADVTLNLKDADIATLIATVSEVTGKNFIVDPRVKGKVTVVSSSPMNADAVYETFLAVLEVEGFAAIPTGSAIKIVPDTNARTDYSPFSGGKGRASDEIVTHVIEIKNGSASQLVPILRPLNPQWAHLAAYVPSNMLIITDRAANVERIEKLVATIDRTGDREVEIVKLENAAAAEVVRTLTSMQQQDKTQEPGGRAAIVLADERTNSVIIGGDKNDREKMMEIIKKLDLSTGEEGSTQVIFLRYADAESLAPILEGYASQQGKSGGGNAPAAANAAPAAASGDKSSRIIADPDTNALVITAPPKTMKALRNVIAQLDFRRAQVLVEAVIAEVSATKSAQLGIDWAVFNPERIAGAMILDSNVLTAANAAITAAATGSLGTTTSSSSTSGLTGVPSILGQGATFAGGRISDNGHSGTSFAALVNALQGDGDTNVLSTPSLVTMDNEEAEISVGQEVPFLTGQFSNTGVSTTGSVNPFQTIQRKDVGLTLGITPQINEGDSVTLTVDLEVSSLSSGTAGASDLITNKRTISNTVNVESGQVLVIGGLIDDNLQETQRGLPFLSRIPFFGALFSSRSVNKQKRNLMLFLHPVILRGPVEMDYYTRKKYDQTRDSQIEAAKGAVPLIGGTRPVMLPFDKRDKDLTPTPANPPVAPAQQPPATPPGTAPTDPAVGAPAPAAPPPTEAPAPSP